jgi:hypothetical protein
MGSNKEMQDEGSIKKPSPTSPKGRPKSDSILQHPLPLVPSEITDSDCQEIATAINRSLTKRKEVINLLLTLEEAWKTAIETDSVPGKTKPPTTRPELLIIAEAEHKRLEAEKIRTSIFQSFESLTKNKNEGQIKLGEDILQALPAKSVEEMMGITEMTQIFLEKEGTINKQFLRDLEQVSKKTDCLLSDVEKALDLPCQDTTLSSIVNKELKILKNFLRGTKKLLNG